ncbi:MAG: site-specific DNA-methyltransferase [Firmicutes bacterium]|nr:site-specific DNA-methyltransferase [Bacillota bacterium]
MNWHIEHGDSLFVLPAIPEKSASCCVTSPPYWGLRDYGIPFTDWPEVLYSPMPGIPPVVIPAWRGCLGLESTPEAYVGHIVLIFRKVWQVLKDDGILWLNLGDCYFGTGGDTGNGPNSCVGPTADAAMPKMGRNEKHKNLAAAGLKPKDLVGIPWRVAFALQADGWYLRIDNIWNKLNPMPESVTDRPTKAHEYIFLLTKSSKYYYDSDAIKEEAKQWTGLSATFQRESGKATKLTIPGQNKASHRPDRKREMYPGRIKKDGTKGMPTYAVAPKALSRNKRSVWNVATVNYPGAHFATFPPKLIEPCILAGSKPGDIIIDPFNGAATTGVVSLRLSRRYIGIEHKQQYVEMSRRRIEDDMPLFNRSSV